MPKPDSKLKTASSQKLLILTAGAALLAIAALVVGFVIYPRLDFHSYTPQASDVRQWVPALHDESWEYNGIYANRQVISWQFRVVETGDAPASPTLPRRMGHLLAHDGWMRHDPELWYRFPRPRTAEVIRVAELDERSVLIGYVQSRGAEGRDMKALLERDPQFLWARKFFWPKYEAARTFYKK